MKLANTIFFILLSGLAISLSAQESDIQVNNLSVDSKPLIPLDPVSFKPTDTIPALYFFNCAASELDKAKTLFLSVGTSAQSKSNIGSFEYPIIQEGGNFFLETEEGREPVFVHPPDMLDLDGNGQPDFLPVMITIPVKIYTSAFGQIKYAEVSILDDEGKLSRPAVLVIP